MLQQIWQYKLQIIPILLFIGIYELPAFLRRIKKTFYVPIYFSVYPLRQINQDLSTYLAEDYFLCQGCDLNSDQAESLRKKIIFTAVVSAVIDAAIVPLVMGLIAAFILDKDLFFQFVIVFVCYKIIAIALSLKESHLHFIESKWKTVTLTLIYIAYLGIVVEMLKTSYLWAEPYISTSDWAAMLNSFSSLIFGKILAQGIVFAGGVSIFTNFVADRKLREQNISGNE